jgi:hypothetical protein
MIRRSGYVMFGQFANGNLNGIGLSYSKYLINSNEYYEGYYKDGLEDGIGIHTHIVYDE